jgi:alpha-tubulin suppressor-like RCC1 family protein
MPTFYNFTQDGLTYSFDDIFVKADPFRQGNLWNWGRGVSGALGNFTGPNFVSTPTTTFAGSSNWKQVSTGGLHTVAIKTDGTLWVWGYNIRGQLGNASTSDRNTPVTTFAGGNDWKLAEGGTSHTIAIKTDGTLWTWGVNDNGQLGVNARDNSSPFGRSTPVTTFVGGTNWKQVSAGYDYSAAIKTDGTLWTWGYAYFGQLGTGGFYTLVRSTPQTTFAGGTNWADVDNSENLYTISFGFEYAAAIKTDGTLWTWGRGVFGQLGNASIINIITPITTFAGGTNWKQISAGGSFHTAAIKTDGTLWTWGSQTSGVLGNRATATNISTPITTFAGGTDWKQVSTGSSHTAAIKTDGTLWAWGNGNSGRLGNGVTTGIISTPVTTFAGGTDWRQISCGNALTSAIKTDGTLWTWGYAAGGRLGNAVISANISTPVTTFAGGTDWKQVSSNLNHTAAVKTDGTLWTWGAAYPGRLGNGVTTGNISTPITTFAGGNNWRQVSTGNVNTSAMKNDGTIWVWGDNVYGRLGNANVAFGNRSTPITTFSGGADWRQVNSGGYNTAALKNNGQLYVWGNNAFSGQLGINNTDQTSTPVTTFAGGTNWADVDNSEKLYTLSGGGSSFSAIKTDGTLWVWGNGNSGALGNAVTTGNISTPVTTFAGGTTWKQVSSGGQHTAAIKTDGTLWTWGNGNSGRLGNATTTINNSTPVTTFTGGTNWKQVSVGFFAHMAAIKTDGTLWTWGNGNSGRLGNATTTINNSTPVTTFTGGTNWKQVSCGGFHTAAIKTDGTLWTWGYGRFGRLGNAVTTNVSTPVTTFAGGTNWKQVDAGERHTTAIKTDGTLWTWGYGRNGQLGNAVTTNISTPITTFAGGTNWKQISAGSRHTATLKTDGTLWVWGSSDEGDLANGKGSYNFNGIPDNFWNISTPITTFAGGSNWAQASSDLALKTDGTLWTWGYNRNGQLGDGFHVTINDVPRRVGSDLNWKQVSCSYHSTAAVKTDGTLWTWGYNDQGQLGTSVLYQGSADPVTTFAGGTDWKQVSAGGYYSVNMMAAIKNDATLWTWGNSHAGILGNATAPETELYVSTPITTFAGGIDWKQVSAGGYHMSAVKTNGTLWTWGSDDQQQLGIGDQFAQTGITYASTPVTTFIGGSNWKSVGSSGGYRVCAIEYNDILTNPPDAFRLFTWGYGKFGSLGNADTISRSIPVTTFIGGTNWKQASAGRDYTAAIKTDGTLWTWGLGTSGYLGNAATTGSISTPITTFTGGTNWKQISAGNFHIAAIKTDGTLWVWGNGRFGRLGNGITIGNRSTPVTTFSGGTNWREVCAGYNYTEAIKTDGTLWIWGRNNDAQLGNATFTDASTPITTFAGGTNWKQVSAGYDHAAAIKTDGTLWTWGFGRSGRLGDANTIFNRYVSTPITTFAGGTDWKQLDCGSQHTAGIKNNGTLWVWGSNINSSLGSSILDDAFTPITTFAGGTDWKEVSAGGYYTAAVKTDGTLWSWGSNSSYRLGVAGGDRSTPVTTFAGGTNWNSLDCGYNRIVAITKN